MTVGVSAILLAAGQSSRMGRPKQLLPFGTRPVIMHCIDALIKSGIEDIVVVLGTHGKEIEQMIRHLPLSIIYNNDPSSEMVESVMIGLASVDPAASGILVHLSDYPLVSSRTLRCLVEQHSMEPNKILIPVFRNKKGHPCLFPKDSLNKVFQGITLREVIRSECRNIVFVEASDDGILFDMDMEQDYMLMLKRFQGMEEKRNEHPNEIVC